MNISPIFINYKELHVVPVVKQSYFVHFVKEQIHLSDLSNTRTMCYEIESWSNFTLSKTKFCSFSIIMEFFSSFMPTRKELFLQFYTKVLY